jgi:hypothetical protein
MSGWLATGSRLEKYGKDGTECPKCSEPHETIDHLFRCPQRTEFRRKYITQLTAQLQLLDTPKEITSAIVKGVRGWLKDSPELYCGDTHVEQAFDQQTTIGWKSWLRGIQGSRWAELMEQHYQETPPMESHRKTGISWHRKLIKWTVNLAYSLWKERNAELHDKDEQQWASEAAREITCIYELETEVEQPDQAIFQVELAEQLRRPWRSIRMWLMNTMPQIKRSIAHRK